MASRWLKPLAVFSALALCVAAPRSAAAQATIMGRVTSQDGEPLQTARVLLVGTALSTTTGQDGRYVLRNVPTGPQTVRVVCVGYREQRKATTVGTNATVGMDFALEKSVVQLEEIVSTATGSRPREELGNSVGSINASKVTEGSVVANLQDVLAARVPGVTVQTGQQTGSGGRVRIRGNSSLNLSNEPIYIIDGIRMTSNSNSSNLFTGGSQPVRVNDLNPEEIENIEIVKGPSAATLYGTDAANGVIVITTKRGRAGATRWTTYAEGGLLKDYSDYPYNYTTAGHSPGLQTYRECTNSVVAAGTCVRDSVRIYSPLHDPDATPVGTGDRNQFGVSASGGNEAVRYFLSGERENETNVLTLPGFERRRMNTQGIPIRDYNNRPNALEKYSTRANINTSPTSQLDLSISSGLVVANTRFVTESNATAGLGSQIYGGKGYKDNGNVSFSDGTPASPLTGYRAWTPGYTFQELNQQRLTRVITSGSADWRPRSWMQNRATLGVDYTARMDINLNRKGEGPPLNSTYRLGFAEDSRTAIRNLTFDLGSTSTWHANSWTALRTTVGTQYVNYYFEANDALGSRLAPGAQTPNSGSVPAVSTSTTLTKTLGAFVEEQVGMHDRLFVTGALRSDQNSAFGTKFQRVMYPKLSVSWIASDESYFPSLSWLDQLRLRAAYGKSGVQPGSNDALRTFSGITTNYKAADVPAVGYNLIGNDLLRPEQTSEFETGFDVRFLRRANAELTFYRKNTKDALIDFTLPPSAGTGNGTGGTTVRKNLGAVRNTGFEALVSSQVFDLPSVGLDFTVTYSANNNKLMTMGKDVNGNPLPPVIGTNTRAQVGYPLFGFWAQPILGWKDKDGNGILTYNTDTTLNEVFIGKDTIYRAYSSPRYTATLLPGLDLLNKTLRVVALFEYKGGFKYYNNTERIRCASRNNCNGLMNPNASFEEQAMAVAHLVSPSTTLDGFYQPGAFVRWREMNVTYTLPSTFAARYMRADRASVNFAARNLHLWTKYRGLDPEIAFNTGESPNVPSEFQTMGTPTYFVFRINLGF
jgi:TonB-linked SusC/RagA family outer membrane protein